MVAKVGSSGVLANLGRDRAGGSLVELSLLLPLLTLLLVAAGDFGRVMYSSITLSHAARSGAAYGSQSAGHSTDTDGIRLAAQAEAQNIGTILVSSQQVCECTAGTPVACTTPVCGTYGVPLAFVEVTAVHTFTMLVNYPGLPSTIPLTRRAKLRVQ